MIQTLLSPKQYLRLSAGFRGEYGNMRLISIMRNFCLRKNSKIGNLR